MKGKEKVVERESVDSWEGAFPPKEAPGWGALFPQPKKEFQKREKKGRGKKKNLKQER